MTDSLRDTIERLRALADSQADALVPDAERPAIDHAVTSALAVLTADPALQRVLAQFSAREDRRPARAADVVITLQLLERALREQPL